MPLKLAWLAAACCWKLAKLASSTETLKTGTTRSSSKPLLSFIVTSWMKPEHSKHFIDAAQKNAAPLSSVFFGRIT